MSKLLPYDDVIEHLDEYTFFRESFGYGSIGISEEQACLSVKIPEGIFKLEFKDQVPPQTTLRGHLIDLGFEILSDMIAHNPENTVLHPRVSAMYTRCAIVDKLRDLRRHSMTEEKFTLLIDAVNNDNSLWEYDNGFVYMYSDNIDLLEFFNDTPNATREFLRFERPQAYHNLRHFLSLFLVETISKEMDI